MSKRMLGRPGDFLGIILDFTTKLSNGSISLEEAKRWLRKEEERRPVTITGELQKEVERLIDRCEGDDKEKYLAVAEFMLKHGIIDIDIVGELYNKICPEFRKDWRVLVGTSYKTMTATKSVARRLPETLKFLYADGKGRTSEEISTFLDKWANAWDRNVNSE